MIVVMVVSPARFLFDMSSNVVASCPFATVVPVSPYDMLRCNNTMVTQIMGRRKVPLVLILNSVLVGVFFFQCAAQVLLELFLFGDVAHVWLQVGQGLVQLAHENLVVSLAKVSVIIATELVVSVDHVTD